jgi:CRISPR-associated protein Cst2
MTPAARPATTPADPRDQAPRLNLFATVLTHAAPGGNYRGDAEDTCNPLQKIARGDAVHTVISPEALRNATRDLLARRLGADSWGRCINRRRLFDAGQPAVEFHAHPDATRYADDFLFGYLVADGKEMRRLGRPSQRASVLRMNLAVSVEPYRYDATFHQAPHHAGASPWRNAGHSALLQREVSWTAYQYPFALAGGDFTTPAQCAWGREALGAIAELTNVAGGHARAYYEMAPHSIIARLTPRLVGGFDTYGFTADGAWRDLDRLHPDDLPPGEFWLGGAIARNLAPARRQELLHHGATLVSNPQHLLERLAEAFLPSSPAGGAVDHAAAP